MTITHGTALEPRARAREIAANLSATDAVGLLFHPILALDANHDPMAPSAFGASSYELIVNRGIRHFFWHRFLRPPRQHPYSHGCRSWRPPTVRACLSFSPAIRGIRSCRTWGRRTEQTASRSGRTDRFGALDDPDLVRAFAGSCETTTERWVFGWLSTPRSTLRRNLDGRVEAQSFGADAMLTSRLLTAFLEGMQGPELGGDSVAATVKHFPGGGAQLDGEDPHFPYGREQVYPGGRFEDHLLPFRAAVAGGAAAIMPYYGMPVGLSRNGTAVEQVGFGFNRALITDLLRDELGFKGVVLQRFRTRPRRGRLRKAVPGSSVGSGTPRPGRTDGSTSPRGCRPARRRERHGAHAHASG